MALGGQHVRVIYIFQLVFQHPSPCICLECLFKKKAVLSRPLSQVKYLRPVKHHYKTECLILWTERALNFHLFLYFSHTTFTALWARSLCGLTGLGALCWFFGKERQTVCSAVYNSNCEWLSARSVDLWIWAVSYTASDALSGIGFSVARSWPRALLIKLRSTWLGYIMSPEPELLCSVSHRWCFLWRVRHIEESSIRLLLGVATMFHTKIEM